MATTAFSTSDVQTVKRWSERMLYDTISDETLVGQMFSDGSLMREDALQKAAGDNVKFHFLNRINQKGLIGDQAATGNEKALTYYQDQLNINELRQPVQIPNKNTISAQRVTFDMPEDTYTVLRNYIIERQTVSVLNQLAGNTATTISYDGISFAGDERLEVTGMNSAIAPTRAIYAGTGNTTDATVNADSTATFTFRLIDAAVAEARKTRPYITPFDGAIKYKCYVHIDGFRQLVNDTSAPIQYRDIMLSKLAGGKTDAELIGEHIDYFDTRIIATDKLPNGVNSGTVQTNTRRAVFVGKNAGCLAFGQGFAAGKDVVAGFGFNEDFVDIKKWRRIAVSLIWGAKKVQFNSSDYGVITLVHYVA